MAGFEQTDAQLAGVAQKQRNLRNAQRVFVNMAATLRAAGRTATEADEVGQQMFRGKPE